MVLHELGRVCTSLGKQNLAAKYLNEALQIRQELAPNGSFFVSETLQHLGYLYRSGLDHRQAAKCFEDSLRILQQHLPRANGLLGQLHLDLGSALMDSGEYVKAGEQCDQAIRATEMLQVATRHLRVAECFKLRGNIHYAQNRYDEAEESWRKIFNRLQLHEKLTTEVPFESKIVLHNSLGDLSMVRGRYIDACQHFKDALNVGEQGGGCCER